MKKFRLAYPEIEHLPRMVEIERSSFQHPWSEIDFVKALRSRQTTGAIALTIPACSWLRDGLVLGFVVYETTTKKINVLNLAVDPKHRGRGVGSALVDHLKHRATRGNAKSVEALTSEYNLPAQLFFRSRGFLAEGVVRYANFDYDGYWMIWRRSRNVPRNRLLMGVGGSHVADL